MKLSKNNAGLAAEQLAATFLLNHGLKLVMQNYHCKFGEIDLIMKDGQTLVFVEVRLRTNNQFGSAAGSITPHKQEKLLRTAQHYLQHHGDCQCRIDAILMDKANLQHIEWIHNAISA